MILQIILFILFCFFNIFILTPISGDNMVCQPTWTLYKKVHSIGGKLIFKGTLEECKNWCILNTNCLAVDFMENKCWFHDNRLDLMTIYNNSYVDQMRINRNCDATTSADFQDSQYENKFDETESNIDIIWKRISNSSYHGNASDVINILSSVDDALASLEALLDGSVASKGRVANGTSSLVLQCSRLLSANSSNDWSRLSPDERSQITGKLFLSVDRCAALLSRCMRDEQDKFILNSNNIIIEIITSLSDNEIIEASYDSNSNVQISKNNFYENSSKVVFIYYKNDAKLFTHESNSTTLYNETRTDSCGSEYSSKLKSDINSNIMSASIIDSQSNLRSHLNSPINITFQHINTENIANSVCVYWNFSLNNGQGAWSTDGCRVSSSFERTTTCICDHLTNFAILMSYTDHQLSAETEYRLSVITFVGCVISIVCLLFAFLTFSVFKNLDCDRNSIHKNLVVCLFTAELIFFFGIDKFCAPLICSIITAFLHYFFLSAFMWMLMEGIQLYVLLIHVFNADKRRMKIYYPVAYGIPAAIVLISLAISFDGYGTKNYCWLSKENGLIWAFIGPVIVILIINTNILIMSIVTMCGLSNNNPFQPKTEEKKLNKILLWIKSALVLMVLLGSTWLVGLFCIDQSTVFVTYLFTILNSLQGCFIFICHCLLNKKVRKEYYRCWLHLPCHSKDQFSSLKSSKDPTKKDTEVAILTLRRNTERAIKTF